MPEGTTWKARVMWKSLEYPLYFLLENPSASLCRMLASLKKRKQQKNLTKTPKQNKFMQRRRSEPCQNSLCCDVTAQTPLSRLWLELSDTDFHGAAWLPTASACWFRAAVGDELTELQALRAVCVPPSRGTPASPTVHGTPWIPAPWIPAQQLDSCLLECSNWCFRCKIVWGHSGVSQSKAAPIPCS